MRRRQSEEDRAVLPPDSELVRDLEARVAELERELANAAILGYLVENSQDQLVYLDRAFRFVRVNRAYADSCGKAPGELAGRNYFDLYPDAETQAIFERVRDTGEPAVCREKPFTSHDQPERGVTYWDWTLAPVKEPTGVVVGLVFSLRDVTEMVRGRQRLEESEERFRLMADGAPSLVWVTDTEGRLKFANRYYREFLGVAYEDVARGQWQSFIHPDDIPAYIGEVQAALRERKPFHGEARLRRADGVWRWVSSHAEPRRSADGEFLGYVGLSRDVTERKEAEFQRERLVEALRETDRRRTEFLAMLSHELRNPLTPIRNSIYILEHAATGGEQARRAQAVIDRQSLHMMRLIQDLLDVTRISRGKFQLHRERVDLNDLIQRTAEDHHSEFARNNIHLDVHPALGEVWVNGDRTRLAQVLGNLLQNAGKFTPRGGSASVAVEQNAARREAVITVADTGSGIAPEMIPRLFEPFAQAETTLDRSKGGLGLGLALVKGLVEMHGGTVRAESLGPGHGSTFVVTVPLDTTAVQVSASQELRAKVPRCVLIIEDNRDAADSLREALDVCGHIVEVAYGGLEGLEKARVFEPDVVLCDIGLPGIDGYAVARAMRADPELSRVALVALTGYAQPEDATRAKDAGFDAHVAKPPDVDLLGQLLADLGSRPTRVRDGGSGEEAPPVT